ncbi:hypothetical protein ACFSTE_04650 [Aquimarina hainanensis]|uniref:Peptidase M23 domain-containing protein n=1 Tax=Aquimarina hainanensis TaxID=1578017 RepID=A0ABW5N7E5_9FLAO
MTKKSAGFKIKLVGKYKGEHIRFNYIHLMQFEKTRFRFYNQNSNGKLGDHGWLNYNDFATTKQFTDPKKKETYTIHYDNGILKIDQNEIDVELALNIKNEYDLNIKTLKVKKGQIIGYTGSTGNSYQGKKANHLHFNTYINYKSVLPYEEFKEYFNLDISGTETSKKQDGVTPSSKW